MADKSLTESAWKAFSKTASYKDGALVKALAAFEKSEKSGAQEQLDALDEPERLETLRERAKQDGKEFLEISAVTNLGTKELVSAVAKRLEEIKQTEIDLSANSDEYFADAYSE